MSKIKSKRRKNVFLFRDNKVFERCAKTGMSDYEDEVLLYIKDTPMIFEHGNFFRGTLIRGVQHGFWLNCFDLEYKDITTILTENEFEQLRKFCLAIKELGNGIDEKNDKRYVQGVELCKGIQPVYDKLNSKENEELYEKILEEEIAFIMKRNNLSKDDIKKIYEDYPTCNRNRSTIFWVYDSIDEFIVEKGINCELDYAIEESGESFDRKSIAQEWLKSKYITLCEGETIMLVELDGGRIASMRY